MGSRRTGRSLAVLAVAGLVASGHALAPAGAEPVGPPDASPERLLGSGPTPAPMPLVEPGEPGPVPIPLVEPREPGPVPMPQLETEPGPPVAVEELVPRRPR